MEKLKLQKDISAQVIITLDNNRMILENCKVYYTEDNAAGQIVIQIHDENNPPRTVQVLFSKSTPESTPPVINEQSNAE